MFVCTSFDTVKAAEEFKGSWKIILNSVVFIHLFTTFGCSNICFIYILISIIKCDTQ